jgi:hypothetical protein
MTEEIIYPDLTPVGQLSPLEQAVNQEIHRFFCLEDEKTGGQLYSWYRDNFVPRNLGLAHYDLAIARFYLNHCSNFARFVEIGAAAAQQSILLAAHHVKTSPVDHTDGQFTLMTRLIDHMARHLDPELPRYIEPVFGSYPGNASQYVTAETVLSFPGLAWSGAAAVWEEILAALSGAGGVILNKGHFFWYRPTEDERQQLVEQIRARGFDAPVAVSDWRFRKFVPDGVVFMKRSSGGEPAAG